MDVFNKKINDWSCVRVQENFKIRSKIAKKEIKKELFYRESGKADENMVVKIANGF